MFTAYFICYFYVDGDGCQIWKNRLIDNAPINWLIAVRKKQEDIILMSWQKMILKDAATFKELTEYLNNPRKKD